MSLESIGSVLCNMRGSSSLLHCNFVGPRLRFVIPKGYQQNYACSHINVFPVRSAKFIFYNIITRKSTAIPSARPKLPVTEIVTYRRTAVIRVQYKHTCTVKAVYVPML